MHVFCRSFDAYRKYADLPISALKVAEGDTSAEVTVKSIYRQAIQEGNVRAAIEIADRVDGRVPLPVTTPEGGEFVLNIISHIPRPEWRDILGAQRFDDVQDSAHMAIMCRFGQRDGMEQACCASCETISRLVTSSVFPSSSSPSENISLTSGRILWR